MSRIFSIDLDPLAPIRVGRERGRIAVPRNPDGGKTSLEIVEEAFRPRAIAAAVGNEQVRHDAPASSNLPSADWLTRAIPEWRNKARQDARSGPAERDLAIDLR